MSIVKYLKSLLIGAPAKPDNTPLDLEQMLSDDDSTLKAIGRAVLETRDRVLTEDEQIMLDAVEARRERLLANDAEINVIDYGAGPQGSVRTRQEMDTGVKGKARINQICKASKKPEWALLLFKLVQKLRPTSCLELGSCVGVSAAYQSCALNLNGHGQLVSLEGSPEVADLARETIAEVGGHRASVMTGPFHQTLTPTLRSAAPVDFFFNDGHHDHDAVLRYFEEALPHLDERAVVVFDDISWSPGMQAAWTTLRQHERVAASLDLGNVGLVLLAPRKSGSPCHFRAKISRA